MASGPAWSSMALEASRSAQSLDVPQDTGDESIRDSVRVYVRTRPPTEREQVMASQPTVVIDRATCSVLLRGDQTRNFTFDGVLGENSTQEETFDLVGRGVAASCLAGYNGSVYVYGQTGVGKTYTMSGPVTSVQSMQFDERRGLICRTLDCVFAEVHRRRARTDDTSYLCRCSFLEIYKEQITDLLEPSNTSLQIREDMNRGVYVERLSEPAVSSLTEAFQVLWRGLQQRHIGATHMNERSSRSHAVFTLSVEAAQTRAGVTSTRVARLSLVDLAGSERQQGALDAAGVTAPHQSMRVKEAGAINKSLSALTNVVMSLSRDERSRRRSSGASDGRRNFVHYRDSKLTFLLRDSLGGNSKTVIVANISPSSLCYAETLSTLKFAARAKHIRCAAVRNEEFSGTLEGLMLEVKTLRQRLSDLSGHGFSTSHPQLLPGACAGSAGADALTGSDAETAEGSPLCGTPREEGEEAEALYSRKRIRRLEVLLAAALERERFADQRRHQLQRLAGFLEDLDFRKSQSFRKLHADYIEHIAQIKNSAVSDDGEGSELTAKLLSFRRLLGNLVAGGCEESTSPRAPGQLLDEGPSGFGWVNHGSAAAPGGTADGPPATPRREVDAGTGALANTPPPAPGGLADEASFLQEENRRLRLQLEQHPEVQRLAAENRALRAQLEALDPTGGSGSAFEKARTAAAGRGPRQPSGVALWGDSAEQSTDGPSDEDDGSSGESEASDPAAGRGWPEEEPRRAVQPLTSEMMLNFSEADDDGTLQTWVFVQKMAKEVQELLHAKDGLAGLLKTLREEEGRGQGQRGPSQGAARANGAPVRGAAPMQNVVESQTVEEVAQAAQDALRLAHSIADVQKQHSGAQVGGDLPTPVSGGGSAGEPAERNQVRQALQKVKDLHGTLDLVNSAYNDAYDKFQRLREEYESRIEECQFFELQCSRLDMHCHDLAERLHGAGVPVRAGMGSFSVTGLSPVQANTWKQKRSFSLSSLRDVSFWEQRFEELSQLTGIEEADTPKVQQHHYGFQLPPRQVAQAAPLAAVVPAPPSVVDALAGAAVRLQMPVQDSAVAAPVVPGSLKRPLSPSIALSSSSPKVLAYSTSLSSLQGRDGNRPQCPLLTAWGQRAFRRVASAPLIACAGEPFTGQAATVTAAATAPGSVPEPAPTAAAQGLAFAAPAASVAFTEEAQGPSLEQAVQMYMRQMVSVGSPALGAVSTVAPATSPSTTSLHGSLSSTAIRHLASNLSNQDLRREAPRGGVAHPAAAQGHVTGRRLGGGGGSRGDVTTETAGAGNAPGPFSARAGAGRGSGGVAVHGSRCGPGVMGTSPRSGQGMQRPTLASASTAGRYPTARAAQSGRPQSLSLSRPRYLSAAATARAGNSLAFAPAALQQRHGA